MVPGYIDVRLCNPDDKVKPEAMEPRSGLNFNDTKKVFALIFQIFDFVFTTKKRGLCVAVFNVFAERSFGYVRGESFLRIRPCNGVY